MSILIAETKDTARISCSVLCFYQYRSPNIQSGMLWREACSMSSLTTLAFAGTIVATCRRVLFFPPISKVYPSASKGFHNTIFRCKDTNNNQNCTLCGAVFCCFCTIEDADLSGIPATDRPNKKTLRRLLQRFSLSGKEGIRTLEALLTLTRFPGGPLQPLEHLSVG